MIAKIDAVGKEQLEKIAARLFKQTPAFAALGPVKNVMPYNEILARLK